MYQQNSTHRLKHSSMLHIACAQYFMQKLLHVLRACHLLCCCCCATQVACKAACILDACCYDPDKHQLFLMKHAVNIPCCMHPPSATAPAEWLRAHAPLPCPEQIDNATGSAASAQAAVSFILGMPRCLVPSGRTHPVHASPSCVCSCAASVKIRHAQCSHTCAAVWHPAPPASILTAHWKLSIPSSTAMLAWKRCQWLKCNM